MDYVESRVLYEQGKLKLSARSYAEAIVFFRQAVILYPEHGPTQFELAKALALDGRSEEALAQLKVVLTWAPLHPGALGLYFDILSESGRYDEAFEWSSKHPAILLSRSRKVEYAAVLHILGFVHQYESWVIDFSAGELKRVRTRIRDLHSTVGEE